MNRSILFGLILAGAVSGLVFASENRVPNGRFEITGSLGSLVTNTPSTPTGFAAAAAWSQSLLAGTYLITRLEPSTDPLSGACGHQFSIRAKSPTTGNGLSVISANLSAAPPVGSRGQLHIRVLNGSARIGFLPNAARATDFDAGSVTVADPTAHSTRCPAVMTCFGLLPVLPGDPSRPERNPGLSAARG